MGIAGIVFVIVCTLEVAEGVLAGDNKTEEPAKVVDQVGTAVKHTATKIEQEVSGVVKKLEESETPKKVGNELKRSAESLEDAENVRQRRSRRAPSSRET